MGISHAEKWESVTPKNSCVEISCAKINCVEITRDADYNCLFSSVCTR